MAPAEQANLGIRTEPEKGTGIMEEEGLWTEPDHPYSWMGLAGKKFEGGD